MTSLAIVGIGTSDIIDFPIADIGTTVTHVKVTETEDFRGNKTEIFTGTNSKKVILVVRGRDNQRVKPGVRNLAPAYMMYRTSHSIDVDTGTGIKKNDKIIVGTGTFSEYRVFNPRPILKGDPVAYHADLYLWD